MNSLLRRALAWTMLLLAAPALARVDTMLAPFSSGAPGAGIPAPWMPYSLAKGQHPTRYEIADVGDRRVLRASAQASASALIHPVRIESAGGAWLNWSWRVDKPVRGGDPATRGGDDFAARIYVLFDPDPARLSFAQRAKLALARAIYGKDVPAAALCYVWDPRQPSGRMLPNPYTERVRMIVAEGSEAPAGKWVAFSRNVAEDYRRAFGEDAPPVIGVVVAADTDNTGETTLAYFGDISFSDAPRAMQ